MRIDKFLKVSRLVKRRSVAQELLIANRVMINEKVAKKSASVKVGDTITLKYGSEDNSRHVKVKVEKLLDKVSKDDALTMYKVMGD